jgi:hypothetical protein
MEVVVSAGIITKAKRRSVKGTKFKAGDAVVFRSSDPRPTMKGGDGRRGVLKRRLRNTFGEWWVAFPDGSQRLWREVDFVPAPEQHEDCGGDWITDATGLVDECSTCKEVRA